MKLLKILAQSPEGCTIFEINVHFNRSLTLCALKRSRLLQKGLIKEKWGKDGVGLRLVISPKGLKALNQMRKIREENSST